MNIVKNYDGWQPGYTTGEGVAQPDGSLFPDSQE